MFRWHRLKGAKVRASARVAAAVVAVVIAEARVNQIRTTTGVSASNN